MTDASPIPIYLRLPITRNSASKPITLVNVKRYQGIYNLFLKVFSKEIELHECQPITALTFGL